MANRSNHAGEFGMDFQTNAGIVLMLANIKEMKSIKLEGNYEDIDIELSDGKHILAQAKSVEDSTNDFRNVRAYLKKGLETFVYDTLKVPKNSKGISLKKAGHLATTYQNIYPLFFSYYG